MLLVFQLQQYDHAALLDTLNIRNSYASILFHAWQSVQKVNQGYDCCFCYIDAIGCTFLLRCTSSSDLGWSDMPLHGENEAVCVTTFGKRKVHVVARKERSSLYLDWGVSM